MNIYENKIINPILDTIEKHQEYLTEKENLPQLAKLGFMFDLFWYAGRIAYGYNGRIKKLNACEDNPKYVIGNINYKNQEIEDFIYDAWGMHVENESNPITWQEFKTLIFEGKTLTDFDKKLRKPNKTFDEWVEVLTDKRYKYSSIYPNRRAVANHLLCTIGNGYGYNKNTGMVFQEASGADQDIDIYSNWENAVFLPEIRMVVEKIMGEEEAKLAIETRTKTIEEYKRKKEEEENKWRKDTYSLIMPNVNEWLKKQGKEPIDINDKDFHKKISNALDEKIEENKDMFKNIDLNDVTKSNSKIKKEKPFEYYPWSDYSIITMIDENSHPSYIKAVLEICKHTIDNPPEIKENMNDWEIKGKEEIMKFAKDFYEKHWIKS